MHSPYLFMFLAIAFEVLATTLLKLSDGFSKLGIGIVSILCYSISLYLLSLLIKVMPVGVVYAIWAGLGVALIALIGLLAFGQKLSLVEVFGIALIVAGVLILNLYSQLH